MKLNMVSLGDLIRKDSFRKYFVSFGLFIFLFLLFPVIFFVTKGTSPLSSELTYSDYSPYGESAGSVIPASCASASPFAEWWWDAGGNNHRSGSHFAGDCLTTCPGGSGTYDPYFDPTASGCCVATTGWGCWSAPNACGAQGWGTINCAGACTGVTPANPWWLGAGCWSAPNACGARGWGTINCAGACTGVTPANPWYLGNSCSVANVCGVSNSGTRICSGACSVGAPALPAGYGVACTSPANNCGSTTSGIGGCTGCPAVAPADIALGVVCQGPANACGMTIAGTTTCTGCSSTTAPSNALCDLAVCKNNCTSTLDRTGNFTVASGPPNTTLRACFYQAGTPACASGVNVTASAAWTETNTPKDAMYFSPTGVLNARYVNGNEIFNVSYLGVTKSPQVTVVCIPNTCSIAPAKAVTDTYCPEVTQDTGVPTGCDGLTLICPGTRKCNYNWREATP
jgi:hypothetical protein